MSEPEIIYADINHGVHFEPYDMIRRICQAVYVSLNVVEFLVKLVGRVIYIFLPSKLAIQIFDGTAIPNFVPPDKKFYAIGFSIAGLPEVEIPIPRAIKYNGYEIEQSLSQIYDIIVHKIDFHIPDSENWPYQDPLTGDVKLGKDCVPPQSYGILGKGLIDYKTIMLIYGFYQILKRLGLFKAAARFMGNLFNYVKFRNLREDVSELVDAQEAESTDIDKIEAYAEANSLTLENISQRIGLRMVMR